MVTPKETTLTYKEATIHIVNQAQTVVIKWESKLDGSIGSLQVSRTNWADGEVVRMVMETIDRCYNKHQRIKNQKRA
ncbi:MAG: hypothetical protein WBG73_08475 [Coleofasciculaceae cyanobacterium]